MFGGAVRYLVHEAGKVGREAQIAVEGLLQIDFVGLDDLEPGRVATQRRLSLGFEDGIAEILVSLEFVYQYDDTPHLPVFLREHVVEPVEQMVDELREGK